MQSAVCVNVCELSKNTALYHCYTSALYASALLARILTVTPLLHCEHLLHTQPLLYKPLQGALPFHMTGVPAIRAVIRDLAPAAAVADYEVPTYIIGVDSESGEMFIELQHQKLEEHRVKVQQLEAAGSSSSSNKAVKTSSATSSSTSSSGKGAKVTANNGLLHR
jgi:hypothetical protein